MNLRMKTVPKTLKANLKYRRELIAAAAESDEFKDAIWLRASTDPIFFFDSLCWTYSPKEHPDAPNRPFILWPFQEDVVRKINSAIGKHDLLIEKSRDMGASWICMGVFFWRWMFFPGQSYLLGSRKQELVDKSGDPKSLFWKMDMLLNSLPSWMVPRHTRIQMHLVNEENGSTIDGESTNDDFARGDRRNAILLDEFPAVSDNGHRILSASRDATNCRIFNGTPQGTSGAYYDTRQAMAKNNPDRIVRLHWPLHPYKRKGLYGTADNKINGKKVIFDKTYRFPSDYHFNLDGKLRSPWYDEQCIRAAHPQEIAQELDIDYAASGWQFFDSTVLDMLIQEMAIEPMHRGELTFNSRGLEPAFNDDRQGRVKFWCQLDGQGRPPLDEYVIGCDIATGKAGEMSSNSVASIAIRKTGQKVAQFTGNSIEPHEFAGYAQALCNLFKDRDGGPAFLIWEENGPGSSFGMKVLNDGFRNIYMRDSETDFGRRKTKNAGWYSTPESKRNLLTDYKTALKLKEFWNPCKEALKECGEYIHRPNGVIEHSRASGTSDPTATGQNHGDMVIADALCLKGMKDRGGVIMSPAKKDDVPQVIPPGSFLYRQRESRKKEVREYRY